MNKVDTAQAAPPPRPGTGWRVKAGFVIFIVSIGWPILVPVLPLMGVSGTQIASFSGVMLIVSELLILAGAAVAGKEGFAFIKQRVLGLVTSYGPPKKVGSARYTIGLVMFAVPLLLGWSAPYFGHHFPGYEERTTMYAIGGDVMLITSLFLLGGDFWDKLRSLFLHEATARIPTKSA